MLSLARSLQGLDLSVDLPALLLLLVDQNPLTGTVYRLRLSVSFAKVQDYQPDFHRLRFSASP